jgi:hypothetical protein
VTTRYYDLLDVHVEVDSDGLRSKLEEIQGTLENHSTRLEGLGDNEWSEDTINDLIEQKLDGSDFVTGDDVDAKIEEHTHEDMDEERVQEIFRDMAHNEGEAMIESLIDDRGYLTSDDVDTKLGDYVTGDDLSGKVDEAIESTGLEARVDTLEQQVKTLTEDFNVHIAALETRLDALADNNRAAMNFFDLIKQAFALLQRGA